MPCVPALSVAVLHDAVRVLPAPVSVIAAQPAIAAPPSVKFTTPVGELPVTDAVKATFMPTIDGLIALTRAVVVPALALTTCDSVTLLDDALPASPW